MVSGGAIHCGYYKYTPKRNPPLIVRTQNPAQEALLRLSYGAWVGLDLFILLLLGLLQTACGLSGPKSSCRLRSKQKQSGCDEARGMPAIQAAFSKRSRIKLFGRNWSNCDKEMVDSITICIDRGEEEEECESLDKSWSAECLLLWPFQSTYIWKLCQYSCLSGEQWTVFYLRFSALVLCVPVDDVRNSIQALVNFAITKNSCIEFQCSPQVAGQPASQRRWVLGVDLMEKKKRRASSSESNQWAPLQFQYN